MVGNAREGLEGPGVTLLTNEEAKLVDLFREAKDKDLIMRAAEQACSHPLAQTQQHPSPTAYPGVTPAEIDQ